MSLLIAVVVGVAVFFAVRWVGMIWVLGAQTLDRVGRGIDDSDGNEWVG